MLTRRIAAEALACALVLALTVGAFARPHHRTHHHRHYARHRVVHHNATPVLRHASPFGADLASAMARDLGSNPTGWAHVWCGYYLGRVAQAIGLRPPQGYQLARNWLHFGMPSGPEPGAVMVMSHHVGVVVRNLGNGQVLLRSGNHNHRVADGVYPVRRAIAFRRPA